VSLVRYELVFYIPVDRIIQSHHHENLKSQIGMNSLVFNPQANYTEGSTATGWRILVPTVVDSGVSRVQRGGSPTTVNLSFLDRSHYLSFN
jgi:hypothetical protein